MILCLMSVWFGIGMHTGFLDQPDSFAGSSHNCFSTPLQKKSGGTITGNLKDLRMSRSPARPQEARAKN